MRVILSEDVDRLGREGDVVDVSAGYARNYLLKRRMAVEATKGALKDLELRRSAIERRQAQRLQVAQTAADRLKEFTITIERKVGDEGRLHGAVTSQEIADRIREDAGMEVERRHIDLPAPLRRAGAHLVTVRLGTDVAVEVPVNIVSDAPVEPEPEEEPEVHEDEEADEEPDTEE